MPCRDAADADDNGRVQMADAVYLLNFIFTKGPPPPAPFPGCGTDPTADSSSCARGMRCRSESLDRLFEPLVFDPLDGHEASMQRVDTDHRDDL